MGCRAADEAARSEMVDTGTSVTEGWATPGGSGVGYGCEEHGGSAERLSRARQRSVRAGNGYP